VLMHPELGNEFMEGCLEYKNSESNRK